MVTIEPTPADQVEIDEAITQLRADGYIDLAEHRYPSGDVLRVGDRVRHTAAQYPEAHRRGTGRIVAMLHRPDSGWSRTHGMADIEVLVLRDEERFGTRVSQVPQYRLAPLVEYS